MDFFFSGISFTAVFNQLSLSPNTDYITDYKGSFSVVYGNNVFASIFKNYNDSSIIRSNINSRKATIFIDALKLRQNKGFGLAIIQMGETNNEVFKFSPIKISWSISNNNYIK